MAADQPQVLNRTVLADEGFESYHTLNARLLGQRRIDRLRLPDQVGLLHLAAYTDALHGWLLLLDRRRRRRRGRHRSDNAADHAARRTTRNAARNATDYAGRG